METPLRRKLIANENLVLKRPESSEWHALILVFIKRSNKTKRKMT